MVNWRAARLPDLANFTCCVSVELSGRFRAMLSEFLGYVALQQVSAVNDSKCSW